MLAKAAKKKLSLGLKTQILPPVADVKTVFAQEI